MQSIQLTYTYRYFCKCGTGSLQK